MFEKYDKAVSLYLKNMERNGLSEKSIESYGRTFRLFRESMVSGGFSEACMEAVVNFKLDKEDIKITSLDLYLTHLHCLSNFAVECGIYEDDFVKSSVMLPKKKIAKEKNKSYSHQLTEEDFRNLINAEAPIFSRNSKAWVREKAIVVTLLLSGMRNTEIRNVLLKDADFENGTIFARNTKGDKPRIVPFPKKARDAVLEYMNSNQFPKDYDENTFLFGVFSKDGNWRMIERIELSQRIYNYTKSILGEEKACRSHSLRHCNASIALSSGVSLDVIQETLGHSSIDTTRIYAQRLQPEKTIAGMNAMFDKII